jgi:hypothetical protein
VGWMTEVLGVGFPAGARDFYVLPVVQIGPGIHLASCSVGTGWAKQLGCEADLTPPSSAGVT